MTVAAPGRARRIAAGPAFLCRLLLMLVAMLSPARPAGVFDLALGGSDLSRELMPAPAAGILPSFVLSPPTRRAGLRFSYQNDAPLRMTRGGAAYGEWTTVDRQLDAIFRVGRGWGMVAASEAETQAGWEQDVAGTRVHWRERSLGLAVEQDLSRNLHLELGWDQRWDRVAVDSREPGLQPTSNGLFELPVDTRRARVGLVYDAGAVRLGGGLGWISATGSVETLIQGDPGSAVLDLTGWQAAAAVETDWGCWTISSGGSYLCAGGENGVFVGTTRRGPVQPSISEWRLGLEMRRPLSNRLTWWTGLGHRDVRADVSGRVTALAPPLGLLGGPRYRLSGGLHSYQTGVATQLQWQVTERSRLGIGLGFRRGRSNGALRIYERNANGPESLQSESAFNQSHWLLVPTLSAEQRVGDLLVGARLHAPIAAFSDHLSDPPGLPGSPRPGVETRYGLPCSFWVELPW